MSRRVISFVHNLKNVLAPCLIVGDGIHGLYLAAAARVLVVSVQAAIVVQIIV